MNFLHYDRKKPTSIFRNPEDGDFSLGEEQIDPERACGWLNWNNFECGLVDAEE